MFKEGQKVFIRSSEATRIKYGVTNEMIRQVGTIQTIAVLHDGVHINNCTWCEEDLQEPIPSDIKKWTDYQKKIDKINAVIPKRPRWLIDAYSLVNDKSGHHNNSYGVYDSSKDYSPSLYNIENIILSDALVSYQYSATKRSCFGQVAKLIRNYFADINSLPDRVIYWPLFENSRINKEGHLSKKEIRRWVTLCKEYGALPKYINSHEFLKQHVIIKIDKKLCYDKLFFYLVNARYCDEHPDIPRIVIYLTDTVGLNFYVSYVMAHLIIVETYDAEHCALPQIRYKKEETRKYSPIYNEYLTRIVYHYPRPRDVIIWSIRICTFINEWLGKPIVKHGLLPGGCPWFLQNNLYKIQRNIEDFPLEVNNKTYNILKGFNPKTSKWRKKWTQEN